MKTTSIWLAKLLSEAEYVGGLSQNELKPSELLELHQTLNLVMSQVQFYYRVKVDILNGQGNACRQLEYRLKFRPNPSTDDIYYVVNEMLKGYDFRITDYYLIDE